MDISAKDTFMKNNLPFYENLSQSEKLLFRDNSRFITYKKRENIQSANNNCIGLIIVKSGELRAYMLSEDGRDITLFRIGENDVCILTANCVLNSITFNTYIDAEKKTEVLLIDIPVLKKLIETNIHVENFFLRKSVDRFSDVMWTMEQILFMGFDKRLAIFLHDESLKSKDTSLYITHEQIARLMGSAREVVSRMLKKFEDENILKLERGKIVIIDMEKLKSHL